MNPYFTHNQRHIQSTLTSRINNNLAQSSSENINWNKIKYNNISFSPNANRLSAKNENMIIQLQDEIRKMTAEKTKLIQENIVLRNDLNRVVSNRDSSKNKVKSIQHETIKSLQDQIKFLTEELKHKEFIIQNNRKFSSEFSKLQKQILTPPNEDFEKELALAKDEIKKLKNEKDKYIQEINDYKKRVDELKKQNEKVIKKNTENNSEIKNKENVILLLSDKNVQQKEIIQNLTNTNDILKIRIKNVIEELEESRKTIENINQENITLTQQLIQNETFKKNNLYIININNFDIIGAKIQKINTIHKTSFEIISNANNKHSFTIKNSLIISKENSITYNKVISNKSNNNINSYSTQKHIFDNIIPQSLTPFNVRKTKRMFTNLNTIIKQQCSLFIKAKEQLIKKETPITKTPVKVKTQNKKQQQLSLLKIKKDISLMIKTNKPKKMLLIDSYKGFTYNQKQKQVLSKKILKHTQLSTEKAFSYSFTPVTKKNKIFKSKTNPKFKVVTSKQANLQIKSNCFEFISIPKKNVKKIKKQTFSIHKESFNMLLTEKKVKLSLSNFSYYFPFQKRKILPLQLEKYNFDFLCSKSKIETSLDNNQNHNKINTKYDLLITQEYFISYNKEHNIKNKHLCLTINQMPIEFLHVKSNNVLQSKNISSSKCTSFSIVMEDNNNNRLNRHQIHISQFKTESFNVNICSQKQIINENKLNNSKIFSSLTLHSFNINYYSLPKKSILSLNNNYFSILQKTSLSDNNILSKEQLTPHKYLSLSNETNFSYNKTKSHFSNLSNDLTITVSYLINKQSTQKHSFQLNNFHLSFSSNKIFSPNKLLISPISSNSILQHKSNHISFDIINSESLCFTVPHCPKLFNLNSKEQKEELIQPFSPSNYDIISDKEEGDLHWYLVISKENQTNNKINYDTCLWIPETQITYPISFYNKYTSKKEIKQEHNPNNKSLDQNNSCKSLQIKKETFSNFEIEQKNNLSFANTSYEKKQEEQFANFSLNSNKEENSALIEYIKKLLGAIQHKEETIKKFQNEFVKIKNSYNKLLNDYNKLQEESKLKDVSFNIKDINNNSFFNEESFIHEITETNSIGDPSTDIQLKNLLSLFISIINLHPEKDNNAIKIYESICLKVGMNENEIKEMMDNKKKTANKKKKVFGIFGKKEKKDKKESLNKSSKSIKDNK